MHESWFSYSLTRHYPFKWFTPVVILGGILLTVLFSVINLASSGYDLRTIYVSDPNATLHDTRWFTKAPWSWGTQIATTCEPQNIPVGSKVITSILGQIYTLSGVSQFNIDQNKTNQLTSLQYINQTLENCQMKEVDFAFRKADESLSGQGGWWSWDNSMVTVTALCLVATPEGYVNATLTAQYGTSWFDRNTNDIPSASMWWGNAASNLYWRGLLYAASRMPVFPVAELGGPNGTFWNKAEVFFFPNLTADIQNDNFFGLGYYFLASNGYLNVYDPKIDPLPADIYNNGQTTQPYLSFSEVVTESMFLAKLLYSVVLVDLGQSSLSNLLLSESNLQWILQHPHDLFRNNLTYRLGCENASCYFLYRDVNMLAAPNATGQGEHRNTPMNEAYEAFKDQVGPLGTRQTTLISQYQCSTPELKSGGTLFVTILIANLVFLQASWYILTTIADWLVERRDPRAMYCQGCRRSLTTTPGKGANDAVELNDVDNDQDEHPATTGEARSKPGSTRSYQPLLDIPENAFSRPFHSWAFIEA